MWLSDAVYNLCGFLPAEAMASTLPFSTIVVAGPVHSLGFPGNIDQTWLSLYTLGLTDLEQVLLYSKPILGTCV